MKFGPHRISSSLQSLACFSLELSPLRISRCAVGFSEIRSSLHSYDSDTLASPTLKES